MMIIGVIFSHCITYEYQHEAFALVDNNSSKIKEGFSLYHSPELGVDIAYPSDWFVEQSDEPMKYGIYINSPASTQNKIDNKTKTIEEALEKAQGLISGESEFTDIFMIDVRNKTVEDPDNIKAIGVQTIQDKKERDPNVNIIEASETTLAGLPAFKIVSTYTHGASGIKEMSIDTLSNNKVYTVSYVSPSYLYDVYLPEVEYAINSTKIK
jgi:hypothetical protein